MTIAPDTKDWTWVLERACPDCGFDASNLDPSKVPALMAQVAAAWQEVLAGAGVEVAQRPSDDRWSTLEYRSEEHTSELQSLMRISYAVFCLQTKNNKSLTQQT